VLDAYYSAYQKGDFRAAFGWFSKYSAEHFQVDIADEIQSRDKDRFSGIKLVDYKVVAKRELQPGSVVVDAWEKKQSNAEPPTTTEQSFVLREEAAGWRIQWNHLVEYRVLEMAPQAIKKVSVQPHLIERYLDGVKVHLKLTNDNAQDTAHWSWPGRKTAQLSYSDGSTQELEGVHVELLPGASKDIWIKFDGYAKAFPTKLVASQWAMGIRFLEGKVPGDSRWSYELPLAADLIPKVAGGG